MTILCLASFPEPRCVCPWFIPLTAEQYHTIWTPCKQHSFDGRAFMGQESENHSAVTSDSVFHEVAIEMSSKVRRSHLKVQLGKELRPHQVALGTCSPLRAGGPRTSLPCPYGSLLHRVWPLRPWGSLRDGSHSLCNLMTEEMFHLHCHTTLSHTPGGRTTHGHEPRHRLSTMRMFNF